MGERFLERYGGQTTEQLLAMEDEYRIDSLVLAFEDALLGRDEGAPITPQERFLLAVEALEREVNNGGYAQFLVNSSREVADVIEEALLAIGCPKTAAITREAIAARGGMGEAEALGACDDHYFGNDEPIADRLFAWIKANRASIRVGSDG